MSDPAQVIGGLVSTSRRGNLPRFFCEYEHWSYPEYQCRRDPAKFVLEAEHSGWVRDTRFQNAFPDEASRDSKARRPSNSLNEDMQQ